MEAFCLCGAGFERRIEKKKQIAKRHSGHRAGILQRIAFTRFRLCGRNDSVFSFALNCVRKPKKCYLRQRKVLRLLLRALG